MHFERLGKYMDYYYTGIKMTVFITVATLLLSIIVIAVILFCRLSRYKILNGIAAFYISFFRGVPVLVQLFLIYFGSAAFTGNKVIISSAAAAIITFTLNSSAYYAENIKGGIFSVDKGQSEAAHALGVGSIRNMVYIVLPQALQAVLPSILNTTITLLKNTSMVSQLGVLDVMRAGQIVMNITYLSFEPLIIVAFFYLTMILLITLIGKRAEHYLYRERM